MQGMWNVMKNVARWRGYEFVTMMVPSGDYYCLLLCVAWDDEVEPWMREREDVYLTLSTSFRAEVCRLVPAEPVRDRCMSLSGGNEWTCCMYFSSEGYWGLHHVVGYWYDVRSMQSIVYTIDNGE